MELFITKLFSEPAYYVSTVVSCLGSICVHEFSHAFIAHKLGDDTAKEGGYMTLNPFKTMGWLSIAALFLFGFSWGAVPVKREDSSRLRRAAISLAGPLSNLALLGIFALLLKGMYSVAPLATSNGFAYYCRLFLLVALYANAILFLFNILPIPVLDGWQTIEPFLPKFLIPSEESKSTIFRCFIFLALFSGGAGVFDKVFGKAVDGLTGKFLPMQVTANKLVSEGNELIEAQDYTGAYKAFEKAAELGSPEGKLSLAICLAEGQGCEANPEKAFAIFSEEGVREFPFAKFYIGIMRMNGLGCTQDYSKAYDLLSEPEVQQATPLARANLGVLLAEGLGVKVDMARAYALFNDAEVMSQSPVARFYMGVFLMMGEVCKKDEARAFELLYDDEVLNSVLAAKFYLGLCFYAGIGTKQDFAEAATLLKEAADTGEPNAVQFLGYQNGKMPDYGMPLEQLLRRMWNERK
ncbi:MAG: SEL1-like repeat protein [Victivallales bacterium]|nr:SEL1-like repeat protein [Victivallales bacterium]MBQ6473288.1 SEL1-like repeat protein [Victivallales bacterium]